MEKKPTSIFIHHNTWSDLGQYGRDVSLTSYLRKDEEQRFFIFVRLTARISTRSPWPITTDVASEFYHRRVSDPAAAVREGEVTWNT